MVDNRSVKNCVILVALIACSHAILWAEGRQLKNNDSEGTAKHGSNNMKLQQNSAELKEDFLSTKPIVDMLSAENTVSVTGENEIYPPMHFGESPASDENDFRPTTPGNSPGVGHKHAKEEGTKSKVVVNQNLNTGIKNDARQPPAPGRSPKTKA